MRNIWIFNHYIIPPSVEKGHRHNKFAKQLVKRGYDVTLFSASTLHLKNTNLIKDQTPYIVEDTDEGKYIILKARDYVGNGKQRILNMMDYYRGIFKVYKEVLKNNPKPDIIYASSVHPLTCVAGIKIAKKLGIKCVIEIRDLWPLSLIDLGVITEKSVPAQLLYRLEKWIYKKADSIIFTREGDKDYIIEKGWAKQVSLDKIYYINNGIDLEYFDYCVTNYKCQDKDLENKDIFKIVYAGSIGKSNAMQYIVESASYLEQYKDKISILIYGDGLERERLESYCKENNYNWVKFKGRVQKEYIPYILSKGDVCSISFNNADIYKYGMSFNKIFDYFASGKPIIYNIICGKYDFLQKYKCGINVEPENAKSFAEGIIKLYELDEKQYQDMALNSRKAASDFDFVKLTDDLVSILNKNI